MNPLAYIAPISSLVVIVVGVLFLSWFKILKETNNLLKEQNSELKAENKEWRNKHVDNEKAIANLQGQIDTLKNIPLQEIATGLKNISETNSKILTQLEISAVSSKQDTKTRAKAVKLVKEDLAAA